MNTIVTILETNFNVEWIGSGTKSPLTRMLKPKLANHLKEDQ